MSVGAKAAERALRVDDDLSVVLDGVGVEPALVAGRFPDAVVAEGRVEGAVGVVALELIGVRRHVGVGR